MGNDTPYNRCLNPRVLLHDALCILKRIGSKYHDADGLITQYATHDELIVNV